jgi:SAM-dependent methyltransferase
MEPEWSEARTLNRARWDELAAIHGQDDVYDAEALIAGGDTLGEEESAALGEVSGRDVLHIQCHIGHDTISLARRGANVTGVDFSAVALERARELARRCGVAAAFVEGDSTDLPASLHDRFELAFASLGVLTWIEDLDAWMLSARSALREGGRLAVFDTHPLLDMIETVEPLRLDLPYVGDGPHAFDTPGSYAAPDARLAQPVAVNYAHSLGEIVSAAAGAGLRVERLVEHREPTACTRTDKAPREPDGRHRLRLGGQLMPLMFTLVARA